MTTPAALSTPITRAPVVLNADIYRLILDQLVNDRRCLFRCALLSKFFSIEALSRLYREITVERLQVDKLSRSEGLTRFFTHTLIIRDSTWQAGYDRILWSCPGLVVLRLFVNSAAPLALLGDHRLTTLKEFSIMTDLFDFAPTSIQNISDLPHFQLERLRMNFSIQPRAAIEALAQACTALSHFTVGTYLGDLSLLSLFYPSTSTLTSIAVPWWYGHDHKVRIKHVVEFLKMASSLANLTLHDNKREPLPFDPKLAEQSVASLLEGVMAPLHTFELYFRNEFLHIPTSSTILTTIQNQLSPSGTLFTLRRLVLSPWTQENLKVIQNWETFSAKLEEKGIHVVDRGAWA